MSVSLLGAPALSLLVTVGGKRPRTLLVETWKKILRLQREVGAEGFRATFSCPHCREPIRMISPHPTEPRLECACTQWVGR